MKQMFVLCSVLSFSLLGGSLLEAKPSSAKPPQRRPTSKSAGPHATAAGTPQARKQQQQRLQAALQHLETLRQKQQIPGMAVAIVGRYGQKAVKGLGLRDVAKKKPVTTKTLFPIGSTTKAMTATGLALLVEQKKLQWSQPIRTYLPRFALKDLFATRRMNAVDLLSHRSGLPRHDLVWYGSKRTRQQIFRSLKHLHPSKDFRTHFQYNNLMYMVAGMLAGRLNKSTWEQFTRQKIFAPLGMTDANFSIAALKRAAEYTMPYLVKGKKTKLLPHREIDAIGPAGSVNAHIEDMEKWLLFQMRYRWRAGKSLLKARTLQALYAPHMVMNSPRQSLYRKLPHIGHVSYGLGWMVSSFRGHKLVFHGGGIDGFASIIGFLPRQQIGLVLLTNKGKTPMLLPMMLEAFERLLGVKPADHVGAMARFFKAIRAKKRQRKRAQKKARSAPSKRGSAGPLKAYAGTYSHPAYGRLTLKATKTQLTMQYHTLSFRFSHLYYNVFQAVNAKGEPLSSKFRLTFQVDKRGQVSQVEVPWQAGVPDIVFKALKKPGTPPTTRKVSAADVARRQERKRRIKNLLRKAGRLALLSSKGAKGKPLRQVLDSNMGHDRTLDRALKSKSAARTRPGAASARSKSALKRPGGTKPTAQRPSPQKPAPRRRLRPVARHAPVKTSATKRPVVLGPTSPPTRLTSRKAPSYRRVRTFAQAVALASREQKPIFLDLYAEWCVPCKKLEAKTFPHPLMHPLLSRYVVVRFDTDKAEGKTLVRRFRVRHYPTTLLLNSRGQEVERIIGFYPARYFRIPVAAVLATKGTYQQLRKGVRAHPSQLGLQLQLADRLLMRRKADEARAIYMKLWKADPNNIQGVGAWALFGVARSYARMGRYELAGLWVQQFRTQYAKPTPARLEALRLQLYIYNRRSFTSAHESLLKTFKRLYPGRSHIYK